jgi:hypothetical protein
MEPSPRAKAICLPFDSEDHYRQIIDDLTKLRAFLLQTAQRSPELFPQDIQDGFTFHQRYTSTKLNLPLRRIKIKASGRVFLIRPSFVLPYMTSHVEPIEKALFLRRWGVSFEALAYVFGRDPKFWERQWLALGRPSLVGTTIKSPEHLPKHLLADEKHTHRQGHKVYLPTTVAQGCILGATLTASADEEDLRQGYDEFAKEAKNVDPDYCPDSICLDGWSATQKAWTALFPKITVILCFLHSVLKIVTACLKRFGSLRKTILDQAWGIYRAGDKRSFAQKLRRLREWAKKTLGPGKLKEAVLKLCGKGKAFAKSFDHPEGCRTSNMLDRLMDYQDRLLYGQRYFHGSPGVAKLAVRAQAMLWNFHPYGKRTQGKQGNRISPFADVNGFVYHSNWLENFLIASSLGGWRQ